MADPTGTLILSANGEDYRLHLGMSVMAEVQAKHGKDFDDLLAGGAGVVPKLAVIHDLFMGALERFHADVPNRRFLVDDIIAQNPDALGELTAAASPDASAEGKAKASRKR
jgi:hypothetical protein